MRQPRFWRRRRPGLLALILAPLSWIWGVIVARRMSRKPRYWPPLPVICIGNFTTGGDGKTPTAIAIARTARELRLSPGFLTRGYGGADAGPIAVETGRSDPREVGDEPLLLAAVAPTVVSRDRPEGAKLLIDLGVDLIIMDDGFQNPSLGKDATIIVVDAASGLGNRMAMPSGPLRASLRSQLALTDCIVLVGDGPAQTEMVRLSARSGKKLIRAHLHAPDAEKWMERNVFAYAGIARPEKFFASLERAGATVARREAFDDHHRYTAADATSLLRHSSDAGLQLVSTEKDMARLSKAGGGLGRLRDSTEAFPVIMEFDAEADIRRLIRSVVEAVRSDRSRRRSSPSG